MYYGVGQTFLTQTVSQSDIIIIIHCVQCFTIWIRVNLYGDRVPQDIPRVPFTIIQNPFYLKYTGLPGTWVKENGSTLLAWLLWFIGVGLNPWFGILWSGPVLAGAGGVFRVICIDMSCYDLEKCLNNGTPSFDPTQGKSTIKCLYLLCNGMHFRHNLDKIVTISQHEFTIHDM